jgi:hypothetical protein
MQNQAQSKQFESIILNASSPEKDDYTLINYLHCEALRKQLGGPFEELMIEALSCFWMIAIPLHIAIICFLIGYAKT